MYVTYVHEYLSLQQLSSYILFISHCWFTSIHQRTVSHQCFSISHFKSTNLRFGRNASVWARNVGLGSHCEMMTTRPFTAILTSLLQISDFQWQSTSECDLWWFILRARNARVSQSLQGASLSSWARWRVNRAIFSFRKTNGDGGRRLHHFGTTNSRLTHWKCGFCISIFPIPRDPITFWEWYIMEPKYYAFRLGDWTPCAHQLRIWRLMPREYHPSSNHWENSNIPAKSPPFPRETSFPWHAGMLRGPCACSYAYLAHIPNNTKRLDFLPPNGRCWSFIEDDTSPMHQESQADTENEGNDFS